GKLVSEGGRPGLCLRSIQSRGHVLQRPWCPAGQYHRVHVVRLSGRAGQGKCGKQSRQIRRKAHDTGTDCGSAKASPRMETDVSAVASILRPVMTKESR